MGYELHIPHYIVINAFHIKCEGCEVWKLRTIDRQCLQKYYQLSVIATQHFGDLHYTGHLYFDDQQYDQN